MQKQVVDLTMLVEASVDRTATELAARDKVIAELHCNLLVHGEQVAQMRAAYRAQGGVIDRQAEIIREQNEARREASEAALATKVVLDELSASVAGLQDSLADKVSAAAAEYRAMGGSLRERADELAANMSSIHEAIDTAVAALRQRVDEFLPAIENSSTQFAAVETRVAQVEKGLGVLEHADLIGSVKIVRAMVEDLEQRASASLAEAIAEQDEASVSRVRALSGDVANMGIVHTQLVQAVENKIDIHVRQIETAAETQTQRMITALEQQDKTIRAWVADVVDDATDSASKANADTDRTVAGLSTRLDGVAALFADSFVPFEGEMRGSLVALRDEAQAARTAAAGDVAGVRSGLQELRERLRTTVSALPKSLVVNNSGDLVAIDGNGDPRVIARVAGRDGRDGAELLDAGMRDGCLVLQMTDGRKVATENVVQQVVQQVQQQVVDALLKAGASSTQVRGFFGAQPKKTQKVKDEGQGKEPAAAARRARRK